jgi:crotonobetainyl-CoA:carnitine CoA-transferase CaiB-like acyl-CoA transferase
MNSTIRVRRAAPLAGVRIVSLAQNVPGPVAVARLVAEGAAAVKVEPPDGDPMAGFSRRWYRHLHRGIEVERLDLKSPEGARRLESLLHTADLLLTCQRPAALARLGITARGLARRHARLRWLNIVGDERHPERPGHDLTYQAQAGLLGGEMPRTLWADLMGAERAVAEAMFLLRRAAPCAARVGLRDALDRAVMPLRVGLTAQGGLLGGGLPTYRVYEARSGAVAVAALEPHFRARLYTALGVPDGADLTDIMRTRTARQWERWAAARDLPIAEVSRI